MKKTQINMVEIKQLIMKESQTTEYQFRQTVEDVRGRTDIVQIIGQHLPLDRNHKALCPFHKETNPSFSVNPKGQYFRCFGCGTGGDVFTFLMLIENKGFKDVLADLARQAGVPIPAISQGDIEAIRSERLIGEIRNVTAAFYHRGLTPSAREYLTLTRGFTEETISKFMIGYAAGGLKEHLLGERGFAEESCVEAGVLIKKNDGMVHDYFLGRIIFPNIRRGHVVHLTGRCLDGSEPKYRHIPGPISYLFNEESLSANEPIIAEGVPDCITAVQAGYSAVGIYGAGGIKEEDVPKFSRCEKIYICLDPDQAGETGAMRIASMLGPRARIIQLPVGYDLNDFFREHSKEEFEVLRAGAKDLVRHKIDLIPCDIDKVELAEKLKPILSDLAKVDPPMIEAYLSCEIKSRFGLQKNDIDAYRKMIKGALGETKSTKGSQGGKSDKPAYTAYFDGLVDLVIADGQPAFLAKKGDGIEVQTETEIDGQIYLPPPKMQIPWLLPRADKVLEYFETDELLPPEERNSALYDDLREYHRRISELPAPEYYDLIAAWVFHTYLLEQFQYTPILCLFAVPERGKSRTGKGIIYVANRGMHVESLRDSYIIRVTNDLRVSLFFDVKDIWKKAEREGSEDILLQRFERGSMVPRVLYPDRGPLQDTMYYKIFGATIIGTNEGVHRILGTRAIQINMPDSTHRFEDDVTPQAALPLKERLVAFRARQLGIPLPDVQKPSQGRLGDILKPILQVIRLVRPDREEALNSMVKMLEGERQLEKAESTEAQILQAVLSLNSKVENGILPIKSIVEVINQDKPERQKHTSQMVGRRLSALGIGKAKTTAGASAIIWNQRQLEQIAGKYGLIETSVTPVTSVYPAPDTQDTDLTEDTGVLFRK
ncbi:MAG: CHC2 zinc finger domain-containing protein [candidate division Zixibacteria bacterium]|nr:CHC2 zinc finger domain-containing protein [candidate division Zixibacteria bacterium]